MLLIQPLAETFNYPLNYLNSTPHTLDCVKKQLTVLYLSHTTMQNSTRQPAM